MKSNQNYNRELQPYAHKLRYSMTKAEACFWKYALQAKMMRGYTFNRRLFNCRTIRPLIKQH